MQHEREWGSRGVGGCDGVWYKLRYLRQFSLMTRFTRKSSPNFDKLSRNDTRAVPWFNTTSGQLMIDR